MLYDDLVKPGEYICHHGIKGQRWGIRRYQNPDGSLTEAGKKHYSYSDKEQRKIANYLIKNKKNIANGKINDKYMKRIDPNKIRDAKGWKSTFEFEEKNNGWTKIEKAMREKFKDRKALNKAAYKIFPYIEDDEKSGKIYSDSYKMNALMDWIVECGDIGSELRKIGINLNVDENGQDKYLQSLNKYYNDSVVDIARDLVGNYSDARYTDTRQYADAMYTAQSYVRRYLNRN